MAFVVTLKVSDLEKYGFSAVAGSLHGNSWIRFRF